MVKDRGVSVKVSPNFYRMMELTRIKLKNNHGIKVKSHIKLTDLMSRNPSLFGNKKWINQIRRGI